MLARCRSVSCAVALLGGPWAPGAYMLAAAPQPAMSAATDEDKFESGRDDLEGAVTVSWTAMRPSDDPAPENDSGRDAEAVGRLVHASVDVRFDQVEFRKAARALCRALGVNLIVFDRPDGATPRQRFDASREIDLDLDGVSGRAALETLIALTSREATWQVHDGIVEVGLRKDLARDDARVLRIHDLMDMSLEAPDFSPCGVSPRRLSTDQVAGEIVRMISTHCEPDAFMPLPSDAPPSDDPSPTAGARVPQGATQPSTRGATPTMNFDPNRGAVFVSGQWASLHADGERLLVRAPDFVHRAIDGYPAALPPRVGPPKDPPAGRPPAGTGDAKSSASAPRSPSKSARPSGR